MAKHCLNCGHPVYEQYCPHCGQSAEVGKLSWKSFGAEFIHILTHAEKSIAGTTWQLIRHPGKVMDEYINGKRKKYHSPVGYFLVCVTLSVLTHRLVLARSGFHPVFLEGLTFSSPESVKTFIVHGEFFYILTFPVSAALFYFTLARPRYAYIDCVVVTMYAFSVAYIFHFLSYIMGGLILSMNVLHWKFYLFQILLSLAYTLWACIDLFRKKGLQFFWFRLLAYMVINTFVVLRFLEILSKAWVRLEEYVQ